MGDEKVNETSRAALVSVTAGMANSMTRGRRIARVCAKCKRGVPAYTGRYPSRCPMCKGALEPPAAEESRKSTVKYAQGQDPGENAPVIATASYAPTLQRLIEAGVDTGGVTRLPYQTIAKFVPGGVSGLAWYTEEAGDKRFRCESPTGPVLVFEFDDDKQEARAYLTEDPELSLGFDPRQDMVEDGGWFPDGRWAELDEARINEILNRRRPEDRAAIDLLQARQAYGVEHPKTNEAARRLGEVIGQTDKPSKDAVRVFHHHVGMEVISAQRQLVPGASVRLAASVEEAVDVPEATRKALERSVVAKINRDNKVKVGGTVEVMLPKHLVARAAELGGVSPMYAGGQWWRGPIGDIPTEVLVGLRALLRGKLAQKHLNVLRQAMGESLAEARYTKKAAVAAVKRDTKAASLGGTRHLQGVRQYIEGKWVPIRNFPPLDGWEIKWTMRGIRRGPAAGRYATDFSLKGPTGRTSPMNGLHFLTGIIDDIVRFKRDGKPKAASRSDMVYLAGHGDSLRDAAAMVKSGDVPPGLFEARLDEYAFSAPTAVTPLPPVLEDPEGTDEDRRASAFRPRREGEGRLTRVYGGTRFTVGSRKRKPRKDVRASIQNRLNAKRGQAKRIDAAKKWHQQTSAGAKLHRDLGRYNTGNRRGESAEDAPFFATTTGAALNIAEERLDERDPYGQDTAAWVARGGPRIEFVSARDLAALERVLDGLFSRVGIDVEFTRHFLDRVNDRRNRRPITTGELSAIFNEVFRRHANKIKGRGADWEAVIKDVTSNINIPFVLNYNRRSGLLELIAKTVMRKKGFKTRNKQLTVQTAAENRVAAARAKVEALTERSWERPTSRAAKAHKDKIRELLVGTEPVRYGGGDGPVFFGYKSQAYKVNLEREWVNPGRPRAPQFRIVARGPSFKEEYREPDYHDEDPYTYDEGPYTTQRSKVFTYPDDNPSGPGDEAFWKWAYDMVYRGKLDLTESSLTEADVPMRELERRAATGDSDAARALARARERVLGAPWEQFDMTKAETLVLLAAQTWKSSHGGVKNLRWHNLAKGYSFRFNMSFGQYEAARKSLAKKGIFTRAGSVTKKAKDIRKQLAEIMGTASYSDSLLRKIHDEYGPDIAMEPVADPVKARPKRPRLRRMGRATAGQLSSLAAIPEDHTGIFKQADRDTYFLPFEIQKNGGYKGYFVEWEPGRRVPNKAKQMSADRWWARTFYGLATSDVPTKVIDRFRAKGVVVESTVESVGNAVDWLRDQGWESGEDFVADRGTRGDSLFVFDRGAGRELEQLLNGPDAADAHATPEGGYWELRNRRLYLHEAIGENFADAYPSNLPPLPAGTAQENPTIDDLFDALLRRLIVIESTDILEDVNFDENGSIYLFFDPSLTRREVDEVYRWIQQEQKAIQLIASPDRSLPNESAEADWWVMFLPGTLDEGGAVGPEPESYLESGERTELPKQQMVVDSPPTAPEQLAMGVNTDQLMKAIGEARAERWLSAYAE